MAPKGYNPYDDVSKAPGIFDQGYWNFAPRRYVGGAIQLPFSSRDGRYTGSIYFWEDLNVLDVWVISTDLFGSPSGRGDGPSGSVFRYQYDFRNATETKGSSSSSEASETDWETAISKFSSALAGDGADSEALAMQFLEQAGKLETSDKKEARGLKRLWRSIFGGLGKDDDGDGLYVPMPEGDPKDGEDWPEGGTTSSGGRLPRFPPPMMFGD